MATKKPAKKVAKATARKPAPAARKAKGKPVSVISTSTDEPDERGLHQ